MTRKAKHNKQIMTRELEGDALRSALKLDASGVQYRTFSVRKEDVNAEDRTVSLSFSSETPYLRPWGWEILGHNEQEVDLSRLNLGGAFLLEHDTDRMIGKVESAKVEDKRGIALVRLSRGKLGSEALDDIADGIRTNVSVGYQILQAIETGKEGSEPVYRITKWLPLEISSVAIPADTTVGVGRADEAVAATNRAEEPAPPVTEPVTIKENTMDNDIQVMNEAVKAEQKRAADILALGDKFGKADMARDFIGKGKTVEDFRSAILDSMDKGAEQVRTNALPSLGLSKKEKQQYSVGRAIQAMTLNRMADLAPFELEVSRAAEKLYGMAAKGMIMPFELMHRDVDYTTEGADTVATNFLGSDFISLLYKKSVLKSLGAQYITGLSGPIDIPRISGGATTYYPASENAGVTESTPTFDRLQLTPHELGCLVEVSKKLLNQQNVVSVDQVIMNDMARAINIAIEAGAINGGGSTEPTGLMGLSINDGNLSASGVLTDAAVIKLETLVGSDDADIGNLAYLTDAAVRGQMKSTLVTPTYGEIKLWGNGSVAGEGIVNGYRAACSNVVPTVNSLHTLLFGNWADLIIAIFGPGLDLTIDPYTKAEYQLVKLVAYLSYDAGPRHLNSFASCENIVVS